MTTAHNGFSAEQFLTIAYRCGDFWTVHHQSQYAGNTNASHPIIAIRTATTMTMVRGGGNSSHIGRCPTSSRLDCRHHTVRYPRRSLADPPHERGIATRVDLDYFCSHLDRDTVTCETSQHAVERCDESRRLDLRDRCSGLHHLSDSARRAQRAGDRCIHVPIPGVARDGARLAPQL